MEREYYILVGYDLIIYEYSLTQPINLDDLKYVRKYSNRKDIFDDSNDIEDIKMIFR
ncbi:5783_t:CDS:2 [Funneliformis caledonium]|uniref:5783_t:CDS:1 n=1 Tax=Funneliformis caledonium TaxID=1117310 RepID=A0A9N9CJ21_9GLOM|nr:5783_t:CDS:2 [Funneliformis caledonium]